MYLKDFLGNDRLIERIRNDSLNNRTPHAIIIEGAEGSGKHTIAKFIALSLACKSANPVCLECADCRKILNGSSPDVISVAPQDGRVQLGIDTVRFIKSDVYIKPNDIEHKVYIINEADKMTVESQNAFLKVLEEPPSYAVFILICESADSMLITVKSRCRVCTTERFDNEILNRYLIKISEEAGELANTNPDALALAVALSGGSIGKALSYVKKETAETNLETYNTVLDLLKLIRRRASTFEIFSLLSSIDQTKEFLYSFFSMFEQGLSDILASKLSAGQKTSFFLYENDLEYMSSGFTSTFLLEAIELIESNKNKLSINVNISSALTAIASELSRLRSKY